MHHMMMRRQRTAYNEGGHLANEQKRGYRSGLDGRLSACQTLPPLLLVLLGRLEVRVAVLPPAEHVAIEAQALAVPLLLSPAPGLGECVFLGVLPAAVQAIRKDGVIVVLPPRCPLVHAHDFESMADGWVDFDRLSLHNLRRGVCGASESSESRASSVCCGSAARRLGRSASRPLGVSAARRLGGSVSRRTFSHSLACTLTIGLESTEVSTSARRLDTTS